MYAERSDAVRIILIMAAILTVLGLWKDSALSQQAELAGRSIPESPAALLGGPIHGPG